MAPAQGGSAAAHSGKYYRVQGVLDIARPPQGYPLLVQAGSSETGVAFAARHAEAVFTAHPGIELARRFYVDLKERARRLGRDPERIQILPGIVPVIGGTEAEDRAKQPELDELVNPLHARQHLSRLLRVPAEKLVLTSRCLQTFPTKRRSRVARAAFHWWSTSRAANI